LKDDLSKLRAGGRFNTATLEGLKVQLSTDIQDSVKLGDLAQVVPKGGRMVTILVAEEDVSEARTLLRELVSLSHYPGSNDTISIHSTSNP
jgi:ribosome recycling factor